jgi:dihydroorotase
MKILIRSAEIIHPGSPFHGQTKDILLDNGIIAQIGNEVSAGFDTAFEHPGLKVSAGWLDMRVLAQDPGLEAQEDLYSVRKAAAAGGFTEIAVLPNTYPVVQTKEAIAYQKNKGLPSAVAVHPIAAVTLNTKGVDLTDMIDLHHAGAVAFSDGIHPLQNADMVLKVLQYLQPFNGLFLNRPEDVMLTQFGVMNEGLTATLLGLKAMPKMAESLMVMRDLRILAYTGGRLHFSCISTAESVELIRQAKKQGLTVSCDVAAHQMAFEDSALLDFDTNLKVNPPFRNAEDNLALWEGLADGTIDCIISDHHPLDEESKNLEFDAASFGIIGLETAFAAANFFNPSLPLEQLIEKFTASPRRLLGLPQPEIREGAVANLTFFNSDTAWVFSESDIQSKSRNTPFVGRKLKGKVLGIVNQGVVEWKNAF